MAELIKTSASDDALYSVVIGSGIAWRGNKLKPGSHCPIFSSEAVA